MTIKFERVGHDNKDLGDIGNYRLMSEKFDYPDERKAILEIAFNSRFFREKGKKLIWAMVFIYNEDGTCNGNWKFENYVHNAELEYTKENVLKLVNRLSKEKFSEIEII